MFFCNWGGGGKYFHLNFVWKGVSIISEKKAEVPSSYAHVSLPTFDSECPLPPGIMYGIR